MVMVPTITMLGGFLMPMIGLGTWMASNETQLEVALDTALEAGYRHIDTAFVYGNEQVIGKVLKRWFDSGKIRRPDVFITTKLPIQGINADRVEFFLNKSLENLGLDYVDLYLVHFPVGINVESNGNITLDTSDHAALWKKLEEKVDEGKAKTIGLSNFNKTQIERIIGSTRIKPACLQIEQHVLLQQNELVDFCHENGIVVVAYSPLGSPSYNNFLKSFGMKDKIVPNLLEDSVVKKIAKKHNKSPAHVLLRFHIERSVVPIPKSVTPSRIIDNIEIFDFSLDVDDVKELRAMEIGEKARIVDYQFVPGLQDSPEWPWEKRPRTHV